MKRAAAVFLAAGLLLAATLEAQARDSTTWRWSGALASGQIIEIKGVHGDIRAERGTGAQVEVVATKSARRSPLASVSFDVVKSASGVTICAMYPTPDWGDRSNRGNWGGWREQPPNECAPADSGHMSTNNNDVRVEWVVRVPAGVTLHARTVNGAIVAERLASDADLVTINGGIRVSTSGRVEAATINGTIDATVGRTDWVAGGDIRTMNGSIHLTLPADADVAVRAQVFNGSRVTADTPMTEDGRRRGRRSQFTYGRGRNQLSLTTMNGSIDVRRAAP